MAEYGGRHHFCFVCNAPEWQMYTEGTKNWKHMIYSHFLSEFERMNNDSFVNFKL